MYAYIKATQSPVTVGRVYASLGTFCTPNISTSLPLWVAAGLELTMNSCLPHLGFRTPNTMLLMANVK